MSPQMTALNQKQLETNIEELRGMPPPLKNPASDSRQALVFGVYDRLVDHGHAIVNVVLAPAHPDGSPDLGMPILQISSHCRVMNGRKICKSRSASAFS